MTKKISPSFVAIVLVVTLVIAVLYIMHVMRSQPTEAPPRRALNAREIELNRLRILGPERAAKIDARSRSILRGGRSTQPGIGNQPETHGESSEGETN